MSGAIDQQYLKQIPTRVERAVGAAFISGLGSGGFAAMQAWSGAVFLPWAVAAAAATLIDGYVVGPVFRMIAEGCELPPNGFELQTVKTLCVTWVVYVGLLPTISSFFGVAMSVNVLATLMMSILASTVDRLETIAISKGPDQRTFTYWFVPPSPLLWPRLGIATAH